MNMRWTSEMDRCLSMILLEQVNLGKKRKSSNKFKPAAYVAAVSALRERFQLNFTKDHVKNRIKAWRKLYSSVKKLLDQNEFHWDEKQKMVIANDAVWDYYIKMHPDARLLQGQVIENYDELCYIIENFNPTESSTNDSEADLDWDTENEDVETEIVYQNRSDNAKERVKYIIWTDEMDRCLTEILVDQLKQGNKLEKKFKPVSFAAALTVLNENFALNVTKENIKSRLKTWKKLYGLVKELLSH
ncbi:uncharacterized protein LOC132311536 [Cornus florida]|uniref:uncharacterized protein LOC132311536 n=1 Tax=Cornus florida TaxID=4283 RepID=UPI0028A10077|nr:uncharacterized protein LOC132311536 [Cornus florida]